MDDPDAGRNNSEGGKGLLTPFEKFITFPITFEFMLHIEHEGLRGAVDVDLDGVVDNEVDGDERFDELGIFFEAGDGVPHGGKIYEEGDAGKVLQDDAGHGEGNLLRGGFFGIPAGEVFDVARAGGKTVAVAKNGFEHDAKGYGEARKFYF